MAGKRGTPKGTVFIIHVGGEYLVRPATLIVKPSTRVTFRNYTNADAMLIFPDDLVEGGTTLLVRRGRAASATVIAKEKGAHACTAVIPSAGQIARGNSAPIIIIDP